VVVTVEVLDRRVGLVVGIHLDKSKAAAPARFAVG
jgi:hypothetical protein